MKKIYIIVTLFKKNTIFIAVQLSCRMIFFRNPFLQAGQMQVPRIWQTAKETQQ